MTMELYLGYSIVMTRGIARILRGGFSKIPDIHGQFNMMRVGILQK
jgi:hypothetical protein